MEDKRFSFSFAMSLELFNLFFEMKIKDQISQRSVYHRGQIEGLFDHLNGSHLFIDYEKNITRMYRKRIKTT